ncbi:MAG: LD-carboxypeptidase [Chitinophagales bacterium]|nr:LD-carboxypeptidase [Chitinophagales bacterium]MCZ2393987.1 LD-carboxypeptidase [Chitinophagales bacterium]
MYIPASLNRGDTIGLVCMARKIDIDAIQSSIQFFEQSGFKVKIGKSVGATYHQFGGDDDLRRIDLQMMLDDTEVKAIFSCRGGYGTVRIIDDIYYGNFISQPKWIVGYSDITVLHAHLNHVMGISTLHATMPVNFETNSAEALQSLLDALMGKSLSYHFGTHPLNKNGQATGKVIGGNLSIIYSLLGTKTLFNSSNKILFLEDLDEYLYHIDRMMVALKRAGKLNNISALIVGGMTDMKDNPIPYGKSAEEIIYEHTQAFDYPICFGFPAGHITDNRAIKLGVNAQIDISENGVKFSQ